MTLESRLLKYIQCLIILFISCSNQRKISFRSALKAMLHRKSFGLKIQATLLNGE